MDEVYDKIIIQDTHLQLRGRCGRQLSGRVAQVVSPRPQARSTPTCKHIRAATRSMPARTSASAICPRALQPLVGGAMRRAANPYFARTTKAVMADFIQDPKLASVLCGQWGDYGLPPAQSSFAMHAVVAQHYLGGGNFPIGGASQIARHIEPVIQRAGGRVVVSAEVEQIMVEGNRAIGVRMGNGDEILCHHVISAAGVHNTYGKLLPDAVGNAPQLREKLSRYETLCGAPGACTSAYTEPRKELGLEQANKWIYQDYDHDASLAQFMAQPAPPKRLKSPLNYISFPSSKTRNGTPTTPENPPLM
jgi:all-trans-retinol 13,14-reductase